MSAHATSTVAVQWRPVSDPPDSDLTVLVHCPQESEPVFVGWLDGDAWRDVHGMRIRVAHWADLPPPPGGGS